MSYRLPLTVYIHVPKTGGTSVNEMMKRLDPFGVEHVERFLNAKAKYIDQWSIDILTSRLNWISGHVRLDEIAKSLIWLAQHVEYFGTIREPISQIISHINFISAQASVEYIPHYSENSYFRNVDIRSTNFQDPYDVIRMLTKYSNFLMNNQSRTILGKDFDKLDRRQMHERLQKYRYISTENNVSSVVLSMGYSFLEDSFYELNKTDPSFDYSIFYEYPIRNFLENYHRFDIEMYNIVADMKFRDAKRDFFRPSYVLGEEFSAENFDDQDYLFSCPDVEWAINKGIIHSASCHFRDFGWQEKRRRIVKAGASRSDDGIKISPDL